MINLTTGTNRNATLAKWKHRVTKHRSWQLRIKMKYVIALVFMLISHGAHAENIAAPTFNLQAEISASVNGRVVIPAGTYTTTGLICVSNITIESDGPVLLSSSTAAPILDLSNCNHVTVRGDFILQGNGPNYAGYGSSMTDGAQVGIKLYNSSYIRLEGHIEIRNIAGNGIDAQDPAFAFNVQTNNHIDGVIVHDTYRGIYLHNYAEYMSIENCNANNNVFGVFDESGNNTFSNCKTVYNSIGMKLYGGANNAHGVVSSLISDHNTYNLTVQGITNGETFSGCNFIAGQDGTGQGVIQIIGSSGVSFNGGQLSYADMTVDNTSQVAWRGMVLRGPVNVTVSSGGLFDAKNQLVAPGSAITLNGSAWTGNN